MPKPNPVLNMPEKELQENVRQLALLRKWLYYHTYRSTRSPAGFPDIVLVRRSRVLFAELKKESGKPSDAQQEWLDALRAISWLEVYVWRPTDWINGIIESVLE